MVLAQPLGFEGSFARNQLRVVRRQVKRPQLGMADRAIMSALSRRVSRAIWVGMLVQPETVFGWHRQLVNRRWAAFGRRRGPGRPRLDPELQTLILEMAKDNAKWGCVRIRGELLKVGHVVSATAICKLLRRKQIGPAPLRSRLTWKAFLRAQASAIVLTELAEIGVDPRFRVHDHDAKYAGGSDLVFQAEGVELIRTPIAAPKAKAHMERQIGSTRRECLDWILILNRRHLERVLAQCSSITTKLVPTELLSCGLRSRARIRCRQRER